ncbi:argininosuccinate lyase [Aureibacter tunicatorum]|uniref:Argininosuccinate lyase n=1 Tax=Aureibacter tunicatorum TaxID=866807 RepID=A0AAE3XNH6_9BACT|nr:argininosuccinate lyase [Aureibacter tunicatorum]MDR6239750.1 argininosuccinate lyase [Aureibacter tunicatorum]BDD04226.1 argininosuccinate lyase [Aureibacter tunicatorum]
MKLWDKGYQTENIVEQFTVGKDRELDIHLAPFDVLGSIAHATMLESIDLLTEDELFKLQNELVKIFREIESGKFEIEEGCEDVHSQVELILTKKLGDIGKKIHSGRSRNDQVLVDLQLYVRYQIEQIVNLSEKLIHKLLELSETHKDVLIPGYTHLQVAMPSSFGLWFGAYAESLIDDLLLFKASYDTANQNPLGSAAGYGSSFPLDRKMTTLLLGFEDLKYNVVAAQMGRGKVERNMAFAMSSIASTMAKMSMDTCLYMSQNFGFLTFPDELTTGSSIMPHKKNPDVFELIRGKCNKIQSLPIELNMIINNLPSGYHRDLQMVKEAFIPSIEMLKDCIEMAEFMFDKIIINKDAIKDPKYDYIYSVEKVNEKVLQGIPFREAYKMIGQDIAEGKYQPDTEVKHTHEGSIGNLCNDKIKAKLDKAVKSFDFITANEALQKLLLL